MARQLRRFGLYFGFTFFAVLMVGCAPVIRCKECAVNYKDVSEFKQYFFSSEPWGGVPFTASEKQSVLVKAIKDKRRRSIEKTVPFTATSLSGQPVSILSYVALYEVDGSDTFVNIKSGYVFEVDVLATPLPQRIELKNEATGKSWIVRLEASG